ncbi:MAG: M28 family peptidase [Saprospiraceae bacterium]|nr:M28 family peptidase [Saprospiraceae bacterium]
MKYTIRILLFLLVAVFSTYGCKTKKELSISNLSMESVKRDVVILSADDMEGRETGTPGEKKAAGYIASRMEDIGLSPRGVHDGYYQSFERKIKSNPHATEPSPDDKTIIGLNVVGVIDNGAKYTAVIGAHYDHLGYGAEGSLHVGEPEIHNGADDNASGVAGMLRIAEELMKEEDEALNYLFIAFSGEEKGLWGSNYFSKNPTIDINEINYMINMDMIGRLNEEKQLAIYGTGTTPIWEKALLVDEGNAFRKKEEASGVGPSDHTSFYLENLPVLQFFTGQHADYHRPSDDAHLINYRGIIEITNYIMAVIDYTEGRGKLQFTKTKDESQETPDFKVTLGVIPDYLYDGRGMRIDGVKDNRPAFNANLKKGDVIIKMGALEIVDMMSYMKALGAHEKGQTIDITIIRDGKENTRKLTF